MNTLKIPYKTGETGAFIISDYRKQYSSCLHFIYERKYESFSDIEIRRLVKGLNNVELLDSWFIDSCMYNANAIDKSNKALNPDEPDKKVVFGGRKNMKLRAQGKISKENFLKKRLSPLYSIGESTCGTKHVKGNRKFHIEQDLETIFFKPNIKTKVKLTIPKLKSNYLKVLSELYKLQETGSIPITYTLTDTHICISYDESKLELKKSNVKQIENRVLAVDQNPNYLGVSIVDWLSVSEFKIIDTYVFDIKQINDKEIEFKLNKLESSDPKKIKLNNKRRFETLELSKTLVDIAVHYNCSIFAIEDLKFKPVKNGKKDTVQKAKETKKKNKKSKNFNRLVNNNWCRTKLVSNLKKRCAIHGIKVLEVPAEYSSIIGNTLFRTTGLPDMILASLEVSRRANTFSLMYLQNKIEHSKTVIFPVKEMLIKTIELLKTLEEFKLKYSKVSTWKNLAKELKNSKVMYRVPLTSNRVEVFQLNSYKSRVRVRKQSFVKSYNLL